MLALGRETRVRRAHHREVGLAGGHDAVAAGGDEHGASLGEAKRQLGERAVQREGQLIGVLLGGAGRVGEAAVEEEVVDVRAHELVGGKAREGLCLGVCGQDAIGAVKGEDGIGGERHERRQHAGGRRAPQIPDLGKRVLGWHGLPQTCSRTDWLWRVPARADAGRRHTAPR